MMAYFFNAHETQNSSLYLIPFLYLLNVPLRLHICLLLIRGIVRNVLLVPMDPISMMFFPFSQFKINQRSSL